MILNLKKFNKVINNKYFKIEPINDVINSILKDAFFSFFIETIFIEASLPAKREKK